MTLPLNTLINRELSSLAFNQRVLAQAQDVTLPLYDRLRFLGIVSSNLDEFFMVRVAGLKQQATNNIIEASADGMRPKEQLAAVAQTTRELVTEQYRIWNQELVPLLSQHEIYFLRPGTLNDDQKAAARKQFMALVYPTLTPLAVDSGHPFPHLRNKSLNLAVMLRRETKRKGSKKTDDVSVAVVQVPSVFQRLVTLPSSQGLAFMVLEELISLHVGELFPGFSVQHTAPFRVLRNWDLTLDESESEDLLSSIQDELRKRDRGAAVRLELDVSASNEVERVLIRALSLDPSDVYRLPGPTQLGDLNALSDLDQRSELKVEPYLPVTAKAIRDAESMFDLISKKDVLLHHPYESYDPVVRFIEEAADDPDVLAIKQTLYRISADSPIAHALARAVENGKQVTVLVELKARLDEANNIAWAQRMEQSGVHVVYGLIGLKTHCKVVLVVRKEGQGIRRYVHLGTGNYNVVTARQYTDLSFFTTRIELAEDVSSLFNMLTGYSAPPAWKRLAVAPINLHEKIIELIRRETERAKKGEATLIRAKMNALVDPTVIQELYAASQAGVKIDLIIRGICCLRAGVPGLSEGIRVFSVVDRFLEHSRVFAFGAPPRTDYFMCSADWMPRNFFRRIEVMFRIEDDRLCARLRDEVFGTVLSDNVKAWQLTPDGTYQLNAPVAGEMPRSQKLTAEIIRRASEQADTASGVLLKA